MDVLVYGAGLLARQLHHYIKVYMGDRLNLLGFIDDAKPEGAVVVEDVCTVGSLDAMSASGKYSPEDVRLVFAIGYSDMLARSQAFERAKRMGYRFERVLHPKANIEEGVRLGEGVAVLQGALVDQRVTIGDITLVDMGTIVCENCKIGANNFIAAGTTIGGNVTIGANNFIGLNSTVADAVSIGSNNWINAQSLVYKDLGDNTRLVELHEQRLVEMK
ncbi:MAG: hypothetical protein JXQ75_05130 [Phycisphaerae bacterium]|nr:hypothetical protein [Phycisphaerae bacterium]